MADHRTVTAIGDDLPRTPPCVAGITSIVVQLPRDARGPVPPHGAGQQLPPCGTRAAERADHRHSHIAAPADGAGRGRPPASDLSGSDWGSLRHRTPVR